MSYVKIIKKKFAHVRAKADVERCPSSVSERYMVFWTTDIPSIINLDKFNTYFMSNIFRWRIDGRF